MPVRHPRAPAARAIRRGIAAPPAATAPRPLRRYRSGVRSLEDRVSLSATDWSHLTEEEVVERLAGTNYAHGEVVVALEAGSASFADLLAVESARDAVTAGAVQSFTMLSDPASGTGSASGGGDPALYRLTISPDADFEATLSAISNWTTVEWAAPNLVGADENVAADMAAESVTLPAGMLDPSFDADGIARLVSPLGSSDTVRDIARQADDKIVVLAGSTGTDQTHALMRFNTNGTLDTSFGLNGRVTLTLSGTASGRFSSVKIASDGSIFVAGIQDLTLTLLKLKSDGTYDQGFASGGTALFLPVLGGTTNVLPTGMVLQSDGKIILTQAYTSNGFLDTMVVRFQANGALDPFFGSGGFRTISVGAGDDTPYDAAVQSDGKIVVVGSTRSSPSMAEDFYALRLNTNGATDTTFGTGGILITGDFSSADIARRVVIQSDGKILLGGSSSFDFRLVRITSAGVLDSTFGSSGRVDANLGGTDAILALAVRSDGKIVAAGYTVVGQNTMFAAARFNAAGTLDPTFDGDGRLTFAVGPTNDSLNSLVVNPDGSIVLGGYTTSATATGSDAVLVRVLDTGAPDASFGTGGNVVLNLGQGYATAVATLALPDGKTLVAGTLSSAGSLAGGWIVWRLTASGALDTTFGTGGYSLAPTTTDAKIRGLARQAASGSILLLLSDSLVHMTSNGVVDGGGGFSTGFQAQGLTVATDDSIIVVGSSAQQFGVGRILANGLTDFSFGFGGFAGYDLSAGSDTAYAAAIQTDGRILVAGTVNGGSGSDFGLLRLTSNGMLDTSFSGDGVIIESLSAGADIARSVLVRSDGRITVGGEAFDDFAIVQYTANGALDTTFGGGDGKVIVANGADREQLRGLFRQSDGKLLAVGLRYVGGTTNGQVAAARFNVEGTLDASFDGAPDGDGIVTFSYADLPTAVLTDSALGAALQTDGKLLIAAPIAFQPGRSDGGVFRLLTANSSLGSAPFVSITSAAPVIDEGGSFEIRFFVADADTPVDWLRMSVDCSDPDLLAGGAATLAPVGGNTWRYTVAARPDRFGTATLTVSVSDGFQLSQQQVSVTVRPINDAPSFRAGADVAAAAGAATNIANWARDISPGAADEQGQVLTFEAVAADPSLFDVLPVVAADGTLSFTAKPSAAGQSTLVTVRLHDDGETDRGGVDVSTDQTFTITIGNGPLLPLVTDQWVSEDGSFSIDVNINDLDTPPGSIVVTAVSSDSVLTPNVTVSNLGSGNWRISASPAANQFGAAVITITASDGVDSTTRSFALNVAAVNDVPSFVKGLDQYGGPGAQTSVRWASSISAGKLETQNLNFVVTADDPSLFAVQPAISADGTLTYTPAAGKSGTTLVTVRLQDDGGTASGGVDTSASQTFAIHTLAVGSHGGELDPSFGSGGVVSGVALDSSAAIRDTAIQADGKIVVVGVETPGAFGNAFAARYLADGTLDASFGSGGIARIDTGTAIESATAVKVAADGLIYMALNDGSQFGVARLNADGTLDGSFGVGGIAQATFTSGDVTTGMALESDGKIVVVGASDGDFAVVRFTVDGTVDTGFATAGRFRYTLGGGFTSEQMNDVTILNDGRILAAGRVSAPTANNGQFVIVRLTQSGLLDTSFDADGVLLTSGPVSWSNTDSARRIAVDEQGRMILLGNAQGGAYVGRFLADGTIDRSFNGDGWVTSISPLLIGQSLILRQDGKIVIGGSWQNGGESKFAVVQLESDGSFDLSFNGTGRRIVEFGVASDAGYGLAVDAAGRIVLVGSSASDGTMRAATARLSEDGQLDRSFSVDGTATGELGAVSQQFTSIARQADGRYLVAGVNWRSGGGMGMIGRYLADGTLDTSFGDGGYYYSTIASTSPFAVAVGTDGKIVGAAVNAISGTNTIFRLNADGSLDTTFSGDGYTSVPSNFRSWAVAVDAQGRIIISGQRGGAAVIRYLADGTLDTGFSDDGILEFIGGTSGRLQSIAFQADGKMVLGGFTFSSSTNNDFLVARLNADGSLDTTFAGDGSAVTSIIGNDQGAAVAVEQDGKIIVGGTYLTASTHWALVRYLADGTVDTSFGAGNGIATFNSGATTDRFNGMALTADGRIVVAGSMAVSSTSDPSDTLVARFLPDGKLDPTFAQDGMLRVPLSNFTDQAQGVALDGDGKIVVAGYVDTGVRYEGRIFRLLNDTDVAPAVAGVYVKGSTWNTGYLNYLNTMGVGDPEGAALGYALPAGATQTTVTLPWSNVDRITIRFDRDVVVSSADALALYDSNDTVITATAFRYVDSRTVEWTMPTVATSKYWLHLDAAKVTGISELALDGEWTNSSSTWAAGSGDGTAGGNFDFRFNVLAGDFDSSGSVAFGEIGQARLKLGLTTASAGFDYRQDYDGTGSITFGEIGQARLRLGASLSALAEPPPPPGAGGNPEGLKALTDSVSSGYSEPAPLEVTAPAYAAVDLLTPPDADTGETTAATAPAASEASAVEFVTIPAGALDPTFGIAGKVILTAPRGSVDVARDVARQTDGKLIVVGTLATDSSSNIGMKGVLLRLNPDGSIDDAFGDAGMVIVPNPVDIGSPIAFRLDSVEIAADGKIVVAGDVGTGIYFARFYANGRLDDSFGLGGSIVVDELNSSSQKAAFPVGLALQADGKIVASRYYRETSGTVYNTAVVRLTTQGLLDDDFGIRGIAKFASASVQEVPYDVVVQSDGRIIVAGVRGSSSSADFFAMRIDSSGTLQSSFGTSGRAVLSFSSGFDAAYRVTLQSDGKIVLAGESGGSFAVARLNTNGQVDTTFDGDGRQTIAVSGTFDRALALGVQADGKIVVGGAKSTGLDSFALIRLTPTGTLDSSFGTGGIRVDDLDFGNDAINALLIDPDGTISVVGSVSGANGTDLVAARYTSLGTWETTFGVGGVARINLDVAAIAPTKVFVQTDSRIVVIGVSDGRYVLERLLPGGEPDTTFGTNGTVVGTTGWSLFVAGRQDDGKFLLLDLVQNRILRLNSDGQIDLTFGTAGILSFASTLFTQKRAVVAGPDGSIYVVGNKTNAGTGFAEFAVAKFTATGILDPTFDGDGLALIDVGAGNDRAVSLVVLPDGRLVAAGTAQVGSGDDIGVVRLLSNGALDATFSADGKNIFSPTPSNDILLNLLLQSDGKIVVAQTSSSGDSLFRVNDAGELDTGFSDDGILPTASLGSVVPNGLFDVVQQPDGRLIVTGDTSTPGMSDLFAFRLTSAGELDTSFGGDGVAVVRVGSDGTLTSSALQPDGKLIIAGQSSEPDSQRLAVVRILTSDATVGASPTLTVPANQTIDEDAAFTFTLTTTDSDTPPEDLSWRVASTDLNLVSERNFRFTHLGGGVWSIMASPQKDAFGSATVSLSVSDGASSTTRSFQLTVRGINDAPSFVAGPKVTAAAGTATEIANWAGAISTGGPGEEGQQLSFVVEATDPTLFDVLPAIAADGTLTFAAKASAAGRSTTVTVRVRDDGGTAFGGQDTSGTATFTIAVAQPPALDAIADQTIPEGTSTPSVTFNYWDPDTPLSSLLVTATSSDASILPAGGLVLSFVSLGSSRLTVTPTADRYGSVTITVSVSDGLFTTSRSFNLNVTNVDDAPSFVKGPDQFGDAELGLQSVPRWASAVSAGPYEASQNLAFQVTVDDPTLFAVQPTISTDGTLTYAAAPGRSGIAHATVRLTDDGGTSGGGVDVSATQSFVIRVLSTTHTAGDLDTTFGSDGVTTIGASYGALSTASRVVMQSDGKLLVASNTIPGTGFENARLFRFNADGSLDSTFGSVGVVNVDFDSGSDRIVDIALDVQGRIYAAILGGGEFQVVRLNTDGTFDASFGDEGRAAIGDSFSCSTQAMAIQADGRIVVAGMDGNPTAVRFLADGTLDASFGVDGFARPKWPNNAQLTDIVLRDDGRILACGFVRYPQSFSDQSAFVMQLTRDGAVDPTFSFDGFAYFGKPLNNTVQANALALDADDRILVASRYDGMLAVARFDADGTLDETFGGDGLVTTPVGTEATAQDLVIATDGRITVIGYSLTSSRPGICLARYLPDGSADESFGEGGEEFLRNGIAVIAEAAALRSDGSLIVAGGAVAGSGIDTALFQMLSQGTIDPNFGLAGATAPVREPASQKYDSVLRLPDGKYLVGGLSTVVRADRTVTTEVYSLSRFLPDGSADPTFGTMGVVYPNAGTLDLVRQPDGMILGLGTALSRFDADGISDAAFAANVASSSPVGFTPRSFALQSDGKIVVVGAESQKFAIVRYRSDGLLDTTFGTAGKLTFDVGVGMQENAEAVTVQLDGKIVVAGWVAIGSTDRDFVAVRINPDGTLDSTFDGDGLAITSLGISFDQAFGVAVQADGRIVAGGTTQTSGSSTGTDWGLVRYNVDGSLDMSFDDDGKLSFAPGTGNDTFGAMQIGTDGRLLIVGSAVNGSSTDMIVVRLLADGRLDPTFANSGITVMPVGSGVDLAQAATIDPDGKIVVAGYADVGGHYEGTLVRLLNDTDIAPTVAGVYVKGSTWNAGYLDYLNTTGVGDSEGAALGYALPAGATQTTVTLPWSNVDRITIRFDRDVVVSSADALALYDSNGTVITATAFRYVDSRTVEWTVPTVATSKYWLHLDAAKVTGISELPLDGEWTTSSSTWAAGSGDGTAGGNFDFRFNVLAGDFDSSGSVAFGEIGQARLKLGLTTASAGFDYRQDYDGTGSITFGEIGQARLRLGASLSALAEPPPPPGATGASDAFAPLTTFSTLASLETAAFETSTPAAGDPRESVAAIAPGEETPSTIELTIESSTDSSITQVPASTGSATFLAGAIFLRPAAAGPILSPPATPSLRYVRTLAGDAVYRRFDRDGEWAEPAVRNQTEAAERSTATAGWRRLRRKTDGDAFVRSTVGEGATVEA